MEFNSNIADILAFSSGFIRKNQKSSDKMELNSRGDDKNRAVCPESTKLQSVTLQYRFYFQKFSDFLRAGTQNVHLMVLYYG